MGRTEMNASWILLHNFVFLLLVKVDTVKQWKHEFEHRPKLKINILKYPNEANS